MGEQLQLWQKIARHLAETHMFWLDEIKRLSTKNVKQLEKIERMHEIIEAHALAGNIHEFRHLSDQLEALDG